MRPLTRHGFTLFSRHAPSAPPPPPGVFTLPDLFEHQAHERRDAPFISIARQSGDDNDGRQRNALRTLSYEQAYGTCVAVANTLFDFVKDEHDEHGEAPVFGIWLEKSLELHLAILATTCAGATWLPFDPDAPAERVQVCLQDSQARILLCDRPHLDRAKKAVQSNDSVRVCLIDDLLASINRNASTPKARHCQAKASDTAYMIYTSGSTGTPKGIAISHHAALTFSLSERSVLETSTDDTVWQGFSPAFDMFIEEAWVSIAGGAHLIVGTREECQNVPGLGGASGIWAQRGVTLVNCVPTMINIMTSLDEESGLPSTIRLLNLGGEACPLALVKRLSRPGLRIVNSYGPSETTVTATIQELRATDVQVTIGTPLPSYHALILAVAEEKGDEQAPPSPPNQPLLIEPGVEGELAIGGPCLGKGYVGRPELTAEKFIKHPLYAGQKLYRTGDRVRIAEDYSILFIGRIDTQVKHRGFRIELGEIESALSSHPLVQTVSVILSTTSDKLEAFIVCKNDAASIEQSELRQALVRLPSYMQPEAYFFLPADEMPRLPSGKINVKALQEVSAQKEKLQATMRKQKPIEVENVEGMPEELVLLLAALRQVFPQAHSVEPSSDFFDDLGGHSLAAAMFVSSLRKECPPSSSLRAIGLQDIYICRTAEKLASKYEDTNRTRAHRMHETDSETTLGEKGTLNTNEDGGPSGVRTGDVWPVSKRNYFLCGLAQAPALLVVWFFQSLTFLLPYLSFVAVQGSTNNLGWALFVSYSTIVVTPSFFLVVALVSKWLIIGRVKAGEYPLYGVYYYRCWLWSKFSAFVDMATMSETPLITLLWKLMGARIGKNCHIGHVTFATPDLIEIGDDVVLSSNVTLCTSYVERGRLILKPIKIGSGVHIGAACLIEGGAVIENDAELVRMTMVPDGQTIPQGQRWHGSPAEYLDQTPDVGLQERTRPSKARRVLTGLTTSFLSIFVLPFVYYAPQVPIVLFFDYITIPDFSHQWTQVAVLALPAAMAYILLVFSVLIVLRWIVLGKVKEGEYRTTSIFFVRKWFVDRCMGLSLVILHAVYATLYVIPFLRALGVKMGHRAEVSTASGLNFNLTEIGEESFIADNVYLGPVEVRGNAISLRKTTIAKRAFAGNASVIAQGVTLQTGTLVGVMSTAPDPDRDPQMQNGQSCFGSPPVMMPARQAAKIDHPDHLLFAPKRRQIALRLFIEGMRIILPRALIVFAIGFSVSIFTLAREHIGAVHAALMLPFYHFFMFCLPSLAFAVACKWILIGRYVDAEWPLWSHQVWRSEFITAVYEALTAPTFTNSLVGTPFLPMCWRLMGVKIGARVTMLHNDITEHDVVTLGDECAINMNAGAQTHLFEDRVMKIGRVTIGKGATLKTNSTCLPGSTVGDYAQVGSLSLVMKGETVPAYEAWEGAPIQPRRKRQRMPFGASCNKCEASSCPFFSQAGPPKSDLDSTKGADEKAVGDDRVPSEIMPGDVCLFGSQWRRETRPQSSRYSSATSLHERETSF